MTQNWMTWEVSVSKTCVRLLTRDSSTSRQTLMSRYQAVDQKWRWKETLAKVGGSFNETVTIVLWETITWIQLGSISQSHTGFFFFFFFIKPLLAVGLAICGIFVVVNGFRFQVVFKRLRIVWVKCRLQVISSFLGIFQVLHGWFRVLCGRVRWRFPLFPVSSHLFCALDSAAITFIFLTAKFLSLSGQTKRWFFFCFVSFNRRPALMKVISVERCDLMTELVGKMFQWKILIKDVIQKIDKKSSTNSIRNANNFHG